MAPSRGRKRGIVLKGLLQALKRGSSMEADAESAAATEQRVAQALEFYRGGDKAAAESLCRSALALDPRQAHAWSLLGRIALDGNQPERALECYAHVMAIDPDEPDYLIDAAEINRRAGHLGRALELSERALTLRPQDSRARQVRRSALEALGRLDEAVDCLRRDLDLNPGNIVGHSDLLFLLSRADMLPQQQLAAEYRRWGELHADSLSVAAELHANPPDPDRPLRIGYVSADFRRHSMAYFVEPFLARHDRHVVRVYCYSNCARPDDVTQHLRGLADEWRDIAALADDEAARLMRDDGIDILIDLSGHTSGNRLLLFARRPAPVQMTWLGYSWGGTGMAAMDYRITDRYADPEGASDSHYREQLLRLPHSKWCYLPPAGMPACNALPAQSRGYVTFGSFCEFQRIGKETMQAWALLMRRLPGARLRMIGAPGGESLDRMLEIFDAAGVHADRLDLVGRVPLEAYLQQYLQVDIALDLFPCNGATTTCESLWLGVPVVSRSGSSVASRSSTSLLTNAGLAQLVADSWEGYVDIALGLAADLPALAQLRASLRERLPASPLLDAQGFTRDLETLYRDAWRRWCARSMSRSQSC
jgi:predicted O-linked N-acetylglucosamine transferase (SPINDLY family)